MDGSDRGAGGDLASRRTLVGPFRAHHGSISLEERRATEEALKRGELAAVVATASLELGIDMGAVDLVCQVESPGQRVARASARGPGRARGARRQPRPADRQDAVGPAGIGRALPRDARRARSSTCACPAAASTCWPSRCRLRGDGALGRAGAFRPGPRRLPVSRPLGRGVRERAAAGLGPVSHARASATCGRGSSGTGFTTVWRRCPGRPSLPWWAAGRFPTPASFPVYLGDGGPRLGELDEEFVYERRVGETFMLGNSTWRIEAIEPASRGGRQGRGPIRRSCRSGAARARRARPSWARRWACFAASWPSGSTIRACPAGSKRECRLDARGGPVACASSSRGSSGWRASCPTIARS